MIYLQHRTDIAPYTLRFDIYTMSNFALQEMPHSTAPAAPAKLAEVAPNGSGGPASERRHGKPEKWMKKGKNMEKREIRKDWRMANTWK